jgi:hypothetical protein
MIGVVNMSVSVQAVLSPFAPLAEGWFLQRTLCFMWCYFVYHNVKKITSRSHSICYHTVCVHFGGAVFSVLNISIC